MILLSCGEHILLSQTYQDSRFSRFIQYINVMKDLQPKIHEYIECVKPITTIALFYNNKWPPTR